MLVTCTRYHQRLSRGRAPSVVLVSACAVWPLNGNWIEVAIRAMTRPKFPCHPTDCHQSQFGIVSARRHVDNQCLEQQSHHKAVEKVPQEVRADTTCRRTDLQVDCPKGKR